MTNGKPDSPPATSEVPGPAAAGDAASPASGQPVPSPRKLWHEAAGDRDKYIELMIAHGHIVVEQPAPVAPEVQAEPVLEKVLAEVYAPLCPACRGLVSLTDKGFVKVHFASSADVRPCAGSYRPWTG